MTVAIGRRALLTTGCALASACSGARSAPPRPRGAPAKCTPSSVGAGLSYCLVDGIKFRVSGGASLPIGSAQIVNSDDNTAVYLARDAAGFYARSAICTHQCCLLEMCLDNECLDIVTNPGTCSSSAAGIPPKKGGVLFCACHGSAFDADGNALNGPARDPLPAVFVEIDGADIVVDTSRPAAVADRAAK